MRDNNKGFSLIELIVVIAIMSIAAVGASLSYNVVKNADVKKAATTVESLLKGVRTECMGKSSAQYLYIYNDGDNSYYVTSSEEATTYATVSALDNPTKLCSGKISIAVETESGNYGIDENDFARVSFEKSTGAVKFIAGTHSGNLTKITFTKGSKVSTISVAYETGKTSLNAG